MTSSRMALITLCVLGVTVDTVGTGTGLRSLAERRVAGDGGGRFLDGEVESWVLCGGVAVVAAAFFSCVCGVMRLDETGFVGDASRRRLEGGGAMSFGEAATGGCAIGDALGVAD